ncbi:MAG: hypothetical protein JWP30_407 [Homoserinimonas sp.]|jgi:Zn-finger nucleic acid-binding protein|nr:hypothetical protein [Homoserinimonas sp.]
MKCPNDSATLVMSERSGVEIDYCPECRGVWLDRGELDKILERAERDSLAPTSPANPPRMMPPTQTPSYDNRNDFDRDRGYNERGGNGYRGKKKESWLSDLFD